MSKIILEIRVVDQFEGIEYVSREGEIVRPQVLKILKLYRRSFKTKEGAKEVAKKLVGCIPHFKSEIGR